MSNMESIEKCLIKGGQLQALFQRQGEKRRFTERKFRTDDVDDLLAQGVTFQDLCNMLGRKNRPVLWMGEDAFIRSQLPLRRRPLATAPQGFRRLLDVHLFIPNDDICNIEVYGRDSSTKSYASLLNLLLHIIALEDTILSVALRCPSSTDPSEEAVLSVPPSALHRFFSNAQSPKQVYFAGDGTLSEEQCRVLFFQCNTNVQLGRIHFGGMHDGGQSLVDALTSNQSPTSLSIVGMPDLSDELFRAFVLGLRGNSTLKNLELNECLRNNAISLQRMRHFLEALAGNLGLESLSLWNLHVSLFRDDNNWDTLWDAVSHHPCIKYVNVGEVPRVNSFTQEQKVRRTQSIVRALETNIHLSTIDIYDGIVDSDLMEKDVHPTLEVNMFRPHIQTIFQEPDQSLRWKILGRALQHRRVQDNLTIRYLLLSKNADLFQSHAPTRADRLANCWNAVMDCQRVVLDEVHSALEEMPEVPPSSTSSSSLPHCHPPSPSPPPPPPPPPADVEQQCSHKNDNNKRQRRS